MGRFRARRRLLGLYAFALLAASSAIAAPPDERYRLAWQETFRDAAAYRESWSFRYPGWRKEGYLNTEEMVTADFDAGQLVIRTTFDSPPKGGMVSTQGKRRFTHGYFEVKMTLPRHPGHHVSFWMKSDEYDRVGPPSTHGAEIDVIEYLPLKPDAAHFNIHTFGYGALHKVAGHSVHNVVCAGCTHEFGLDWRPDGYTFYVDGKALWSTSESQTSVPAYLILSSHVSAWGGYPRLGKEADEVRFHYVKYYEKKDWGRSEKVVPAKAGTPSRSSKSPRRQVFPIGVTGSPPSRGRRPAPFSEFP